MFLKNVPIYRFVIMFVAFFCLMSIFSNYTIINFTFICMQDDPSGIRTDSNGTQHNIYDYSSDEKAAIIWAVAFGTIAGTVPYNWSYVRFGARFTFLSAGMLSIISTVLIPTMASTNFYLLLVIRFFQGISYAADFAVIGIICVKWAPLDENAFFISALTIFSPFATSITDALTGWLCTTSLGWRSAFYIHSAAGVVCFILWVIVYTDSPSTHPCVGEKELEHIERGKTASHYETKRTVPYWPMIKNPAVLCCWFNAFMDLSMSILLITYSPIYFNQVLKFPIEQTGFIISITNFAQIPVKLLAAYVSDKVTFISPRAKMLIFNTISCGVVAILFGFVGFVDVEHRWWAMILVTLVNCMMSTNCGSYYQCARYVAQQYADVVIAAIQFCKAVALFFVPGLVALTVHDQSSRGQWTTAFLINSGLLLLATFTSYFLYTDKPGEFTKIDWDAEKNPKDPQNEAKEDEISVAHTYL